MSNTGPKVISAIISVRQHSIFLHVRKIDKFCPFSARGIKLEFPRSVAFYNVVIACSYWCGNGTYSVLFSHKYTIHYTYQMCSNFVIFSKTAQRVFSRRKLRSREFYMEKLWGVTIWRKNTGGSKIYRPTKEEIRNFNSPKKSWSLHLFHHFYFLKKFMPRHFFLPKKS